VIHWYNYMTFTLSPAPSGDLPVQFRSWAEHKKSEYCRI